MKKLTIREMPITGKRILTRVDYNVPTDDKGNITDDTRIRATLPTLNHILNNRSKLILMTHLNVDRSFRSIIVDLKDSYSLKKGCEKLYHLVIKRVVRI